jgi:glycosyltransferase involved in cell wall biosynthesis
LAFESLDLSNFDLVISVTSADAKGIITSPSTLHVCYCLTPTRYLWSHEQFYKAQLSSLSQRISGPVFNYLKAWDEVAAQRPDAYLAISQTVQNRITKYYHRPSQVVYPPVDVDFYNQPRQPVELKNFFLYVGRLVAYKRAQILVETFNDLQLPLAIVGSGSLESKLRQIARSNIHFFTEASGDEVARFYQSARALIFFHEEDFGITPVEAMAAGTPVIGLNRGGVMETVTSSTGFLIEDDIDQLKSTIVNFDSSQFDATVIKQQAQKFSKDRFKKEFVNAIDKQWKLFKNISTH